MGLSQIGLAGGGSREQAQKVIRDARGGQR